MITLSTLLSKLNLISSISIIFTCGIFLKTSFQDPGEIRWDWNNIRIDSRDIAQRIYKKKPNFIWGTATSAHQVEGNCTKNNWYEFEQIPGNIRNNDKSGSAAQHYTKYRDDIQLMKHGLGVQSYRFSIEWSKIEPEKDVIDLSVVKHYHDKINYMISNGIIPMVTLQHFTNPTWWQKLGGKNIEDFFNFAVFIFKEYSNKVNLWCTVNEAMVQVAGGYLGAEHAPGKQGDWEMAFAVLKNMMIAHTRIYRWIKSRRNGKKHKVGIVKALHQFDPLNTWNPAQIALCNTMNYVYNDAMLNYFKTGHLYIYIPLLVTLDYKNPEGKNSNDYIGLNYYSHYNVKVRFSTERPFEFVVRDEYKRLTTDMGYPIYAEGFWRAIKQVSTFGVPVYITENGLADKKDEFLRDLYIKRYLWAMAKAIEEGVDIPYYYYWSFMDNFEWAEGFDMKFGLYKVNYTTQQRVLRSGAQFYVNVVKYFKKIKQRNSGDDSK